MCPRGLSQVIVDVQVVMVMFVVVIGQWAPELVMDIIVVALVEIAVVEWQLWSGSCGRHYQGMVAEALG